jgi:hypothetical protein
MTASSSDHVRRGHPILFGLIIVLAIIEMSIAAFLTERYNTHHNFPSTTLRDRARFLLFTSIWTIVFGAFYMVAYLVGGGAGSIFVSVASHGIFLFVTWVFWLAGAAAVTASLGGGNNCSNINFNLPYCNQLNALMGFAWTEWIIVTFAFVAVFILGVRSVRRGDGYRGQLV